MSCIKIKNKKIMIFTPILILALCALTPIVTNTLNESKHTFAMGGELKNNDRTMCKKTHVKPIQNKDDFNEHYFRPSKLVSLNNKVSDFKFFDPYYQKAYSQITLPKELLNSPENTLLNYFSVLREAENLSKDMLGGCGTVGNSKIPYPIAYNFFTKDYQKKLSFNSYVDSFEGIGHINLIKLKYIPYNNGSSDNFKFFVEIETIEGSSKNMTYFGYYYGYVYIVKEENIYKISNIELIGEDFLCAPYHGWNHNAEAVVDIKYGGWCKLVKKRYPTEQEGYIKNIYFKGNDNKDYRFEFIQLTNGTDVEISQYVKTPQGKWEIIRINPEKCLE